MKILETERLVLRHQEMDDLDHLFALYCDPEVRQYIPNASRNYEEARKELAWLIGNPLRFSYQKVSGVVRDQLIRAGSAGNWGRSPGSVPGDYASYRNACRVHQLIRMVPLVELKGLLDPISIRFLRQA